MAYINPEDRRAYDREYIKRPHAFARRKKYLNKWRKKNPDKVAAMDARALRPRALANARRRLKTRQDAIARLGGRCVGETCRWINRDGTRGCTDERALQFDHVHGGGTRERKEMHYEKMLKKILTDENGEYQLLCANCNWIKLHVNKESNRKIHLEKL